MKTKRLKKLGVMFVATAMAVVMTSVATITANAHDSDRWGGKTGYNTANLRFNINSSALIQGPSVTPMVNVGTYSIVRCDVQGWNGVSRGVNITDVNRGLSSGTNTIQVHGVWRRDGVLGYVDVYDSNGTFLTDTTRNNNGDWHRAVVFMNTNHDDWLQGGVSNSVGTQRVRKTFIHEVGHVLKLRHPTCNSRAVMHQGFPFVLGGNNSLITPFRQHHDEINLRMKWGSL